MSLLDGEIFFLYLGIKKEIQIKDNKKTQIKQFKEFMKSRETKNSHTKKDFKKQKQKELKYFEVLFNPMN